VYMGISRGKSLGIAKGELALHLTEHKEVPEGIGILMDVEDVYVFYGDLESRNPDALGAAGGTSTRQSWSISRGERRSCISLTPSETASTSQARPRRIVDDLGVRIRSVLQGVVNAFNPIVEQFQDMAVGYASSILRDVHLAEDAAQNSFVTAFMNLESVRDPVAFPGWLRRIVFTECTRIRRQVRPEVLTLDLSEVDSDDGSPADILDEAESRAAAAELIDSLPDKAQGVTILYYLAEISQKEIATFLHVPEGTVKKRLYDARERMRSTVAGRTKQRQSSRVARAFVVGTIVSAVEAIANGDADKLRSLIRANPSMVNVSGTLDFRYGDHSYFAGASLLHFLTGHPTPYNTLPDNVLEMIEILLDAGADPNATIIVGHTMVSLICYDVPRNKGVLIDMIDLLVCRGADPNAGFGRCALENALWHGETEAARALLRHGSSYDLRLAAGVGRADLMDEFFVADGSLRGGAMRWHRRWVRVAGRT
jgi:RNA polymerase sigma factor (sigma-70 family)